MERSTIFHGKTHYFYGHGFNSKLLNYQRVPRMSFLVVSLIRSRNCRVYWQCRFGLAQGFGHHRDPPKNWTVQGPNIFFWSSPCIKLKLIWKTLISWETDLQMADFHGFSRCFWGLVISSDARFKRPLPLWLSFPMYVNIINIYIYIYRMYIYIYKSHVYIYIYYTVSYLDLLEVSTNQYYWFSLDKLVWIPFYYQLFSMHGLFMLISYTYHQKQIKNKLDNDWTYISQIIHLIIRTKIHPMPQNNTEICPKINRSDNAGPPGWENWGL